MYRLECIQRLPISIEKAWEFFSSPGNLKTITPDYMGFIIKSGGDVPMYPGMFIEYTVTPLFNIPLSWVTEITHVQQPYFFIDEQRVGPYAIWHHEHHFKEIDNGIEMRDILSYQLPLGILGKAVHPFIVKNKIKEIFDFRYKKLLELFGEIQSV